jgi:hypothetical protein
MTPADKRAFYWFEQGAIHYTIVALIALAALYLDLGERALDLGALFPVVVGLIGLVLRWPAAPLALVIALALTLSLQSNSMASFTLSSGPQVADLVLCAAVLAYVMAHYRLTLINRAFPAPLAPDAPAPDHPARSQRLVTPQEIGRIVLLAPVWAILAYLCWVLLPGERGGQEVEPHAWQNVWRLVWLAWLVGAPALVLATAAGYYTCRGMSAEEAGLFLQDVLWKETRWEQRRLSRWLAWGHVRAAKRSAGRRWRLVAVVAVIAAGIIAVLTWAALR